MLSYLATRVFDTKYIYIHTSYYCRQVIIILCWIAIVITEIMFLELSRPVNNETVITWFGCVICCNENDSIAIDGFDKSPHLVEEKTDITYQYIL